jgi:alginate O-acetyltransferase complex protein AlgI
MIQPINIFIVFLLTGLWHGLTLNFLLWGAIHGLAIAMEAAFLGKWLKKVWRPFQHFYALTIVLIGWVFFRSATPGYALGFFARIVGFKKGITPVPFSVTYPLPIIDHSVWLAIVLGVVLSLPIIPTLRQYWQQATQKYLVIQAIGVLGSDILLFILLILSAAALISRTNTPTSIYAKF